MAPHRRQLWTPRVKPSRYKVDEAAMLLSVVTGR
jgi:hypothetical protein